MILENINYIQEVVNPLYAFPVVGVVLCALLVFAFGFKTPAQPPSFDFDEPRKVAPKKKTKSKEVKLPKPVQNGNAHASEPPSNANLTSAKSQTSKASKNNETATAKKTQPVENKNKNKKEPNLTATSPLQEKNKNKKQPNLTAASPLQEKVRATSKEEAADVNSASSEWTQQLSRKDRKGRKPLVTYPQPTPYKESSPVAPKTKVSTPEVECVKETKIEEICAPEKPPVEKVESNESTTTTAAPEEISLPVKDASSVKSPVAETSPKKVNKKKAPDSVAPSETSATKEVPPATKVLKESSKKAKKAPKESSKSEVKEPQGELTDKTNNVEDSKPVASLEKKVPEKQVAVEPKKAVPKEPAVEESAVVPPVEEDSAKLTSNVVFDELGDMWQDAKPQKKKKKVRRE